MSVDPPEVHSPPETRPSRDPRSAVARWLPIVATLRGYGLAMFRADLVAGMVLSTIMVPAAMGYAQAAGLPAITGLYATVGPLTASLDATFDLIAKHGDKPEMVEKVAAFAHTLTKAIKSV